MNFDDFIELIEGREIAYSNVHLAIIHFVSGVVASIAPSELKEELKKFIKIAKKFTSGDACNSDLEMARESVWILHDNQVKGSFDQRLVRLAVCCFYDEGASEIDEMGYEFFFETLFSIVDDLNKNLSSDLLSLLIVELKLTSL